MRIEDDLWIRYLRTKVIMNCLKTLWLLPIKKGKFLFLSFDGKQFSDSPKYIYEFLEKGHDNFEFVWAFFEPEKFDYLVERGIKVIKRNSFDFVKDFATSEYIITNNFIPSYLPVRKSQVLLNTWHGGSPLKTVGYMESNPNPYNDYYYKKLQNHKYTAFLSSSDFVTHEVIGDSFAYKSTVLPFGMPRNAILLGPHDEIVDKVYSHFNLSRGLDKGIVLYAPTFRGSFQQGTFLPKEQQLDIDAFLNALTRSTGKEYSFLFRAHHTMMDSMSGDDVIFATDYSDMQELLCAADVLITDYSSCMGDMALMKKPVFLYTPDLEEYIKERGFYWDIYSLPFPIAKSNAEIVSLVESFDTEEYKSGVQKYLDRLGSYETAQSTKKTVDWLLKQK